MLHIHTPFPDSMGDSKYTLAVISHAINAQKRHSNISKKIECVSCDREKFINTIIDRTVISEI